jgi:hypothetical protein
VRRGVNHGRAVFRIERRRTRRYAGLTALIALVATPILGALLHIPVLMIAIAVAAIVTAGALGHRVKADHCADPECKALLAPGITHCPGCDGTLLGTIAHPDLRLEAAEALARRGIRP